jgi:adenylate cyclase
MQAFRQHALAIIISLALTLLFLSLSINTTSSLILDDLEHLAYDLRLEYIGVKKADNTPQIIVIDIDDKSLTQEGRWPWSRQKIAQLTEKLQAADVAVITFDIQFSEHERNPVKQLLQQPSVQAKSMDFRQQLRDLATAVDADEQFATQLKASQTTQTVIGFLFQDEQNPRTNNERLAPSPVVFNGVANLPVSSLSPTNYLSSLAKLQKAANGNGFITIKPDKGDGILRRSVLVIQHQDVFYPSLALETLRVYKKEAKLYVNSVVDNKQNPSIQYITGINVGITTINTNAIGEILIPYSKTANVFPRYSATDVLNGRIDPQLLKKSIVFIGSSALRLNDLRTTPLTTGYPGVYIQALITHALLHPQIIPVEPDWMAGGLLMILMILGLLLSFSLPFCRAPLLYALVFTLPISYLVFNIYYWYEQQLSIPLVMPLALMLAILMVHFSSKAFHNRQQKQLIRSMFDQYVPPSHINRLLRSDHGKRCFEGERREMTVLFADIRNFTSLSEKLSSNEIKRILNLYFTPITQVILQQEGVIDKYVGDMVMAFWNAPLDDKHHAEHAVKAALAMLEVTQTLKATLAKENLPSFEIGIGISTGFMNVGDMGSEHRRAYTVIGDTVNLGARLESLTKQYKVKLLVTEKTKIACHTLDPQTQQTKSPWEFRHIDCVCVKGREEAVNIYEVLPKI